MIEMETATGRRSGSAQVVLLVVIVLAAALRWHGAVTESYPKPDETVYVNAAKHWSAGRSPYEEDRFFYTPAFAWAAAKSIELTSDLEYIWIQRTLNLLGICAATWLSLRIARWRRRPALVLGVAWICLAPGVALSIELGNAAGFSTALTLAGLWAWLQRPRLAGLSLGVAQLVKPIAPLAGLCLLARKGPDRRKSLRAGLIFLATAALLLMVGVHFLPGLLDNATGSDNPYNFSLQRLLGSLGLSVDPVAVTATLGAGGLWWIARHRLSRPELLVVTLTLSLLAAPILWVHSLLLFLPVQLLATARMVRSLRSMGLRLDAARRRSALPHVLAGLALTSTVFSGSLGASMSIAAPVRSAVLAAPYLSLLYLGVYAYRGLSGDSSVDPRPSQSA